MNQAVELSKPETVIPGESFEAKFVRTLMNLERNCEITRKAMRFLGELKSRYKNVNPKIITHTDTQTMVHRYLCLCDMGFFVEHSGMLSPRPTPKRRAITKRIPGRLIQRALPKKTRIRVLRKLAIYQRGLPIPDNTDISCFSHVSEKGLQACLNTIIPEVEAVLKGNKPTSFTFNFQKT